MKRFHRLLLPTIAAVSSWAPCAAALAQAEHQFYAQVVFRNETTTPIVAVFGAGGCDGTPMDARLPGMVTFAVSYSCRVAPTYIRAVRVQLETGETIACETLVNGQGAYIRNAGGSVRCQAGPGWS